MPAIWPVYLSSSRASSGTIGRMTFSLNLDQMTPEQLRALAAQALQLQSQVEAMSRKIQNDEILIEQFKFEIALLERHLFAKRSEQISPAQGSLLDDLLDTDLEAIEAELKQRLPASSQAEPRRICQEMAVPISKTLHDWMLAQRDQVPNGSATAKALDYSLKRWVALTRYLDDGAVPIDNNQVENQRRPWALGRSNWLFAGSLRSGKRAAAIMSLIQSARMNGHDPYAYLKDVLTRLQTQKASQIEQLLPHQWIGG